MSLKKWTSEEIEILKNSWTFPMREIVALLPDRNRKTIYWKLGDLGFIRQTYKRYTEAEDQYIKDNYRVLGNRAIAKYLIRTEKSVTKRMIVLNLKRTEAELYKMRSGNAGVFKKGQKTKRRWPDGYLQLCYDPKTEKSFYNIKVDGKFVRYSRYLYEMFYNEKLEAKDVIYHKDGDAMNLLKENLEKINRTQLMAKNAELDETIVKRMLGVKEPELVEKMINEMQGVIELKRNSLILNRKLNESSRKNKE